MRLRENVLFALGISFPLLLGWVGGGVLLGREGLAKEKASPLETRVLELEALVHEVQDANSMLLENLAACAEENEALRAELEERCPSKGAKGSRDPGQPSGEDERKGKNRPK